MKKIIIFLVCVLAVCGIAAGVYYFLIPHEFGALKVTLINAGKPVTDLEVDVNKKPGPPKYHLNSDQDGAVIFENLPVGQYAVYFNENNFPKNLQNPGADIIYVTISKNQLTEKTIDLTPSDSLNYKTDDFEVKYPNWPNVNPREISDPNIKVAISDGNCVLLVKVTPLPEGVSYEDYIEGIIKNAGTAIKVTKQEITATTAYLDGEVTSGKDIMRNVAYSYLSSKNIAYGVTFITEKSGFEKYCRATLENVIKSVAVK